MRRHLTPSVIFLSNLPDIKLGGDHVMCAGRNTDTLNAATQNGNYTWELNGTILGRRHSEGQLLTQAPGGQYLASGFRARMRYI